MTGGGGRLEGCLQQELLGEAGGQAGKTEPWRWDDHRNGWVRRHTRRVQAMHEVETRGQRQAWPTRNQNDERPFIYTGVSAAAVCTCRVAARLHQAVHGSKELGRFACDAADAEGPVEGLRTRVGAGVDAGCCPFFEF